MAADDEVRLEHTLAASRSIPEAELAVVPGTAHGLLIQNAQLRNRLMHSFLAEDPVPTCAPIPREPAGP